jgi:hypothetical protein
MPEFSSYDRLAWSEDGKHLAGRPRTEQGRSNVELWDVGACKLVRTITTKNWVQTFTFTPNGKTLIICNERDNIMLVDIAADK